jgi:hypothetical protein
MENEMADVESPNADITGAKSSRPTSAKAEARGDIAGEAVSSYFAQASDTLTTTVLELYQCQRDIMEGMAMGWRNGFAPCATEPNYTNMAKQLHDQSEYFVKSTRRMNDSVRACGWKLARLYAGAAEQASSRMKSILPKPPAA